MKYLTSLALAFLLSACQDYNSSTSDRVNFGQTDQSDPNLVQAEKIIKSKCMNCHSWTIGSNEAWINNGKVVRGDPANSPLIIYIGPNSPDPMPPSGSPQLTNAEIDIIENWILNIP